MSCGCGGRRRDSSPTARRVTVWVLKANGQEIATFTDLGEAKQRQALGGSGYTVSSKKILQTS